MNTVLRQNRSPPLLTTSISAGKHFNLFAAFCDGATRPPRGHVDRTWLSSRLEHSQSVSRGQPRNRAQKERPWHVRCP